MDAYPAYPRGPTPFTAIHSPDAMAQLYQPGLPYESSSSTSSYDQALAAHGPRYRANSMYAGGIQQQMFPSPYGAPAYRPHHHRHTSFTASRPTMFEIFRRSLRIRFKRKGSLTSGITLGDAQQPGMRLNNKDDYFLSDIHPNVGDTIFLQMSWHHYPDMTYQVPLASFDGRLDLESLARRVARSCAHYFQNNRIAVSWDRLELKYLEELEYGVWQPVLSTF